MIVEFFELPKVRNCKRIPNPKFIDESPILEKVIYGNFEKGFTIIGKEFLDRSKKNKNMQARLKKLNVPKVQIIYEYDGPLTRGVGVGAHITTFIQATKDNPFIEIWSDDGFEVYINNRLHYSRWKGQPITYYNLPLNLKEGQMAKLDIYWFDHCWSGALFVLPHKIKEITNINKIDIKSWIKKIFSTLQTK